MSSVLIIGANRGLGAELAKGYAAQGKTVYGTTRSAEGPGSSEFPENVKFLPGVDLMKPDVGDTIAGLLPGASPLDTVVSMTDLEIPSHLLK